MASYERLEQPSNSKRKRIIQVILCSLILGGFIFGFVYLVTKDSDDDETSLPTWSFDDAFNSSLAPKYSSVTWFLNDDAYSAVEGDLIVKYKLPEFTRTVLVDVSQIVDPNTNKKLSYYSYSISEDESFCIFQTNHTQVYRHSSLDTYLIYNIKANNITNVNGGLQLQYAELDPTGTLLAYVYNNDVYIMTLATQSTVRVTTDGSVNNVINGINDWVYEEEVFSETSAIRWSPDGKTLAYLRFTEQSVPKYQFPIYQLPDDTEYEYKYPKPGQDNSVVDLFFYSVESGQVTMGNIGSSQNPDQLVVYFEFYNTTNLAIKIMPRLQNQWQLWSVLAATGTAVKLSNASNPYYLDVNDGLTFFPSLGVYVDLIPYNDYQHLAVYDLNGNFLRMLTEGPGWGVEGVMGVRMVSPEAIFYVSTELVGSLERVLYVVRVSDGGRVRLIGSTDKDQHYWQTASLSSSANYAVISDRGSQPRSDLYEFEYTEDIVNAVLVRTLQNNSVLWDNLDERSIATRRFLTVPSQYDNLRSSASMLLPPDFDDSCESQYPVLMFVYGGPGSQQVTQQFPYGTGTTGWHNYMASTHRYIIFTVDAIGTGGRGESYQKNETYKQLGVNEALGVLSAAKWLHGQCYVSQDRIALWGWSYGGYLSSMVATEPGVQSYIKAIMAVAPVSDWHLYDSIYTERFMQTPQANPDGYNISSVLNRIEENPDEFVTNYLLVHGSADDNVHFQNSALLSDQLVSNNIQFREMVYTNRNHGLTGPGGQANKHLYRLLTDFLLESLVSSDDDDS